MASEAARLPEFDPWDLLRGVDPKARSDAQQALILAYAALGRVNGNTFMYLRGKTTGKKYKLVVFEDQGGPQLGLED